MVSITGISWLLGGYYWERRPAKSRKKLLASIMFVYLVTLIVFALLADNAKSNTLGVGSAGLLWIFLILRAIAGFFFGGIPAKAQAYVMGWTTQETRTWGMALFGAANGLGFVLGPAMSGGLAVISLTVPMYAVALLILIIAVIFLLTIPDEQESEIRRTTATISPNDSRIRLYLWIGFVLSAALNIVQVTIGFYIQDT